MSCDRHVFLVGAVCTPDRSFERMCCSTGVVQLLVASPGHCATRLYGLEEAWPSSVPDAPRPKSQSWMFSLPIDAASCWQSASDGLLLSKIGPEGVFTVEFVKCVAAPS